MRKIWVGLKSVLLGCFFILAGCSTYGTLTFKDNHMTLFPLLTGLVFSEGYKGDRYVPLWADSIEDVTVDVQRIRSATIRLVQDRHWNYRDFRDEILLSNGACQPQENEEVSCDVATSWDRFSNADQMTLAFSLSIRYHLIVINEKIQDITVENLHFDANNI